MGSNKRKEPWSHRNSDCYITVDVEWLSGKDDWEQLSGIGMIVSERLIGDKRTIEHSYFIYSQKGATASH